MRKEPLLLGLARRRDEFLKFLRSRTPPDIEPEDVFQQALVIATRKIGQVREADRVNAWFFKILRNVAADEYARWRFREEKMQQLEETDVPLVEPLFCTCSLKLMETLPDAYADVLRRIDIGEETIEEVARATATTTNNVTVRLHRARKALRARLLEVCGTTSLRACLDCACNEPKQV